MLTTIGERIIRYKLCFLYLIKKKRNKCLTADLFSVIFAFSKVHTHLMKVVDSNLVTMYLETINYKMKKDINVRDVNRSLRRHLSHL